MPSCSCVLSRANHTAWQLGHLLVSEHDMVEGCPPDRCRHCLPDLPKNTLPDAKLDSPGAFHPKSVYMSVYEQQRAGTLKALDKLSDADLDKPGPEKFKAL